MMAATLPVPPACRPPSRRVKGTDTVLRDVKRKPPHSLRWRGLSQSAAGAVAERKKCIRGGSDEEFHAHASTKSPSAHRKQTIESNFIIGSPFLRGALLLVLSTRDWSSPPSWRPSRRVKILLGMAVGEKFLSSFESRMSPQISAESASAVAASQRCIRSLAPSASRTASAAPRF